MSNLGAVTQFSNYGLEDSILYNVMGFMRYGLLELGCYENISVGELDQNGNDQSRLIPVIKKGVTNYTVYNGLKHDWVWESGVTLKASGVAPLQISGIIVNGTFCATGSVVQGTTFYVDYARGRVVFNSGIAPTSVVQSPQCWRSVITYPQDTNQYRKSVWDWHGQAGATGWNANEEYIYLPALLIDVKGYETIRGFEVGSRSKNIRANMEFNILTTNNFDRKKLTDICYMLETKAFYFYDISAAPWPLDHRGALTSGALIWPALSAYSIDRIGRFQENARVIKITNPTLPNLQSKVMIGLELDVYPG